MTHVAADCGNLPDDVREREVEVRQPRDQRGQTSTAKPSVTRLVLASMLQDLFAKYGRIRAVDLKSPVRPPAYAFIEFDDSR